MFCTTIWRTTAELRPGAEQGELHDIARRLGVLACGPDRHGMREAAAAPPGGIFPGKVQDAFIRAHAFRFSNPIPAEEQALVVSRAGFEKAHVLWVVFPAQRAGFGIEGLDPVRSAVFEFRQDHFARGQFVGQHARILAPSFPNAISEPECYNQVPTSAGETGMEIAIQSSDELEQLFTRLRKMSDDELTRYPSTVERN